MHTELQSRLEHLVNYSSQLIFVSGDTIAQQNRTVQAFLSQQSETAEVAFVVADDPPDIINFRRHICRQLLGQTIGTCVRPLNELLASLNHHEGPVLICISRAELLPDGFVQELWDLVLQSRFKSNKQHLNVLLFGESSWTERAKAWLPARNSDKPLLLSSQSVISPQREQSELEQLMATKRAELEAKRYARANPPSIPSRLSNVWVKTGFGLLLVVMFLSILALVYRDEFTSVLGSGDPVATSQTGVDEGTEAETAIPDDAAAKTAEPVQPIPDPPTDVQSVPEPRVTDWETAIDSLPAAQQQNEAPSAVQESTVENQTVPAIDESATQLSELPGNPTSDQAAPLDFPVPDITSDAANSDVAAIRFVNQQLLDMQEERFFIQRSAMSSQDVLLDYLMANQLFESAWVYETQRYGGSWYVVIDAQSYDTLLQARDAIASSEGQQATAFVKRLSAIKQELTASPE